jgi:DNA repair protein RadC
MPDSDDNAYPIDSSAMRIRDMPERLRPREEMERVGVENVSDSNLLAVIIGTGTKGVNVMELATRLLGKYRSLSGLAEASVDELAKDDDVKGLGKVKAQVLTAALEIGKRVREEAVPRAYKVRSPEDAVNLLADRSGKLDREIFWVLRLDTKNALMGRPEDVTQGILDASLVHPREVFRRAIREAAAAIVLVHNHPSGDTTPSPEDIRITRQLVEAGKVVDIRVLDHIVLGGTNSGSKKEFSSMREEGLVQFSGE